MSSQTQENLLREALADVVRTPQEYAEYNYEDDSFFNYVAFDDMIRRVINLVLDKTLIDKVEFDIDGNDEQVYTFDPITGITIEDDDRFTISVQSVSYPDEHPRKYSTLTLEERKVRMNTYKQSCGTVCKTCNRPFS